MIIFEKERTDFFSRLDARTRIASALVLAFAATICHSRISITTMLCLGMALTLLSGIGLSAVMRRLAGPFAFLATLFFFLPFSAGDTELFSILGHGWHTEGLWMAAKISLRAITAILFFIALAGSLEPSETGVALGRLGMPKKLVHLMLFMSRYIEVFHHEYHRLRHAMKIRGFTARFDMHTFRSFGYLVGMLLVRSTERAQRILEAMKCRGFSCKLYIIKEFSFGKSDTIFIILVTLTLAGMGWIEWIR